MHGVNCPCMKMSTVIDEGLSFLFSDSEELNPHEVMDVPSYVGGASVGASAGVFGLTSGGASVPVPISTSSLPDSKAVV